LVLLLHQRNVRKRDVAGKEKGENPKLKDVPAGMQTFVNILKKKEEKKYLASGKDEAYH